MLTTLMLHAGLAAPALAQDGTYITDLTEPQTMDQGGNWGRIFPTETGWLLFSAGGGDYNYIELDEDFARLSNPTGLTGRSDLVDHAFTRCPDGSWLHVASRNVTVVDDSAMYFLYDSALSLVASGDIAVSDPAYKYNDSPALCTDSFMGTYFQPRGDADGQPGQGMAVFYTIDASAGATLMGDLVGVPFVSGSSMAWDADNDRVVNIRAPYDSLSINMHFYDVDGVRTGFRAPDVVDEGLTTYWPQSVLRVGQAWIVAFMNRENPTGNWVTDTGNVRVALFDDNWVLRQAVDVTSFEPGQGAMQPYVTLRDERLYVMYDYAVRPTVVSATLDMAALESLAPWPVVEAVLGPDRTVATGEQVTLDASRSVSAVGGAFTFKWELKRSPDSSALTTDSVVDNGSRGATFTPDAEGRYDIRVDLTEAGGLTDSALIEIIAVDDYVGDNQAPVAAAGADLTLTLGDTAAVDGSASSDPDGDTLVYTWTMSYQPGLSELTTSDLVSDGAAGVSFVPDVEGDYELTLEVWDGLDSSTDAVSLVVTEPSQGDDTADDSGPSADDSQDDSGPVGVAPDKDCGCSSSPAGGSLGLLMLGLVLPFVRRRS